MLADYQILDHLGATAGSDLYRARTLSDGAPVLLKLCPAERAERFRREYATLQALHLPAIPRPLALFTERDCLAMVLDHAAGASFESVLAQRRFDLPDILRLACQLTQILADLHAAGLTHRDLRPANFLFDPDQARLCLLDVSLAAPDAEQAADTSDADDWAYLSPEQTGRMHRALDYRTDFYSLGVVLYRMLTGRLPIQGGDALELMHGHVARIPAPPAAIAPHIPQAVSDIALRLLAKLPEERYQSAQGLLIDLERCLTQHQASGWVTPFTLGTQDVPPRFHIAPKLYGRERETTLLLDAFEHMAASGQVTLATVAGYAGVGKSSLVQGLHQPITQRQGYFIGGKFDQYQRDIPYATLTQAFRELVQQLLTESEERVAARRRQILHALGANGQLIIDVLPQVELIIGQQAPVAELPPAQAQHRFQQVFRRFIDVFAGAEHPLVVFLDDLQWIDAASLTLVEQLLTHPDTRYLLLVGAYRDNEVGPSHPLTASLERIRHSGIPSHEVILGPLSAASLNQLIADTLHAPTDACAPLTQLIFERTEGNPFFFIQFLDALHHEGLLQHDAQDQIWKWNLDQIQARDFADNAVDMVVQKLHLLPPEVQGVLQVAASLGNRFDLSQVLMLGTTTQVLVEQWLALATEASLISHAGQHYKFLHDRIQQAAYSLRPEGERAARHLQIGRALLANLSGDAEDAPLYDIASQLNRGAAGIVDGQEKLQVAKLNLRAGRKAMASAAYATASALCAAGLALLGEDGWQSQHALTFELTLERARCEFATSHFEETERLLGTLLQHAASPIEQAAAYCQQLQLHHVKSENVQAVDHALTCLRLFGIDMAAHPSRDQVQQAYEDVWTLLEGRSIESLIDLPPMSDQKTQAAMQVLANFVQPAYYTDMNLYALALCLMMKLSLQYGNSDSSAHAYASFGSILGPLFHRYPEGYRCAKLGCDLAEQNGFIAIKARVYLATQMAALWMQPVSTAIEFARTGFNTGVETGDLSRACMIQNHMITDSLLRGDALDAVWRASETALAFVRRARFRDLVDTIVSQQRLIANMRGLTAHFSTFSDTQFDEAAFEAQLTPGRMSTMICKYWIIKLQARFLSCDYVIALTAADEAKTSLQTIVTNIYMLDYFYYTALTIAALYETGNPEQQRAWQEVLSAHAEQLHEWAEINPPTFRDKYVLVAAEIARVTDDEAGAMRLYQEAIDAAFENGFPHNEGIAHEAAARFYFARSLLTEGRAHLQAARDCFQRWGADGKVRQLEAHPQWRAQTILGTAAAQDSAAQLDVLSVTKASQAISGRIVLDDLVETLMRIVLENAGAQSGALLLSRSGEWLVAAEARVEPDMIEVQMHLARTERRIDADMALPASVLNYVRRTGEAVLLPDATLPNPFSGDPYFTERQPQSVWCLPIRRQDALLGMFYLEHSLVPHVFTPARQAVLALLAAQAAISLENALLYADLSQENSERKRAEAALRAAHGELEERVRERTAELARSNADLEQFAYVASHDLQEPLRMVTSYLQLLEQRYQGRLDRDANEFIAFAVDGARRMQSLIKDLLTYSRLGSKAKPWRPVDCNAVMDVVRRSLGAAIGESGAQIECASLPPVMGDETQLTQLFQNLVANAIKFRGGQAPRIQIRAEADADADAGFWRFAVQDNGIGIAPEYFERIFVMFQRLHNRSQYAGTGIGLALCKKIVERHGGHIRVASSAAGSTFHFTLPRVKGDA